MREIGGGGGGSGDFEAREKDNPPVLEASLRTVDSCVDFQYLGTGFRQPGFGTWIPSLQGASSPKALPRTTVELAIPRNPRDTAAELTQSAPPSPALISISCPVQDCRSRDVPRGAGGGNGGAVGGKHRGLCGRRLLGHARADGGDVQGSDRVRCGGRVSATVHAASLRACFAAVGAGAGRAPRVR